MSELAVFPDGYAPVRSRSDFPGADPGVIA
jgi:hypothetical protein